MNEFSGFVRKIPSDFDRFGNKSADERKKEAKNLESERLSASVSTRWFGKEKHVRGSFLKLLSDTYGGGRLGRLLSDKNWRSHTLSLRKKHHYNAFGASGRNA